MSCASFIYEPDGNLTQDNWYSYTWDGENRLIRIQTRLDLGANPTGPDSGDKMLEFGYDSPALDAPPTLCVPSGTAARRVKG